MFKVFQEGKLLVSGDQYKVREYIEEILEQRLGFFVSLQENTDDDEYEVYLHTDNYDELEDEQLERLDKLKITDIDSRKEIEDFLNITIE